MSLCIKKRTDHDSGGGASMSCELWELLCVDVELLFVECISDSGQSRYHIGSLPLQQLLEI